MQIGPKQPGILRSTVCRKISASARVLEIAWGEEPTEAMLKRSEGRIQ